MKVTSLWRDMAYRLALPFLKKMDAESSHHLVLSLLARTNHQCQAPIEHGSLNKNGLIFKNRVGLAAGFDKNAQYINALSALGFGFIEVGTITPRPQEGHPRPRLFRSFSERAIINRMGFNNDGVDQIAKRLQDCPYRKKGGVLGVNIGKNATTPINQAVRDYIICMDTCYELCDYITINLSSPNTQDLRLLQHGEALVQLLTEVSEERNKLRDKTGNNRPLFVKISPDMASDAFADTQDILGRFGIDGVILTNTTQTRPIDHERLRKEAGGLSGQPLKPLADRLLASNAKQLKEKGLTIIGVGGICSGQDAREKFEKGADLIQIYSGLVFSGPRLVAQCINNQPT